MRERQPPLEEAYRDDPASSRITLRASGMPGDAPVTCSVEVGRAVHAAEAHPGVGGPGGAACSGDLLLGALAACAQVTCQMVAAAPGLPVAVVQVTVEGDLDLQGTLGTRRDVPVGSRRSGCASRSTRPGSTRRRASLARATERYCVVLQTLATPPRITTDWTG